MKHTSGDQPAEDLFARLQTRASQLKTSTIWWMVFFGGVALYTLTSQRSVAWQDSAIYQWRILNAYYTALEGLAVSHPVLIFLGQLAKSIPIGDVLWRLNSISAIGMSVTLANFVLLVALLTGRRWIGILLAAMLAVSHIAWWLATITETYTWVVAGLTAELWLLVQLIRRPRWATITVLAFLNGVGLSLHDFALLPLPVYFAVATLLVWQKKVPVWSLGTALLAYLAGASVYIGLTMNMAFTTGDPMLAVRSALFGEGYDAVVNTNILSVNSKANAALASLSFMNVFLPLAVLGWFRFKRLLGGTVAWALGLITVIHVVFIVRYDSADQFTSMLPAFVMVAIGAAVGAGYAVDLSHRWRNWVVGLCALSILTMPLIYGVLPGVLRKAGVEVQRARMLPYRDEMRYWITPWKQNENSAQEFTETALAEALPDGVILGDDNPAYSLLVTWKLQPRFQSVSVQYDGKPLPPYDGNENEFMKTLGSRPLFIVSAISGYVPDGERILQDADCIRDEGQSLYRVVWKKK